MNQDGSSATYMLKDASQPSDDTFKVIRYQGESTGNDQPMELINEGKLVMAVGKLKAYAEEFSLVSFHVRELDKKTDVEIFELEVRAAKLFYEKGVLDRSQQEMEIMGVPMLLATGPVRPEEGGYIASLRAPSIAMSTPSRRSVNGIENSPPPLSLKNLSAQQAKILKFIKEYGVEGIGMRMNNIAESLNIAERSLESDLKFLVDKSLLYTTTDEYSFAALD